MQAELLPLSCIEPESIPPEPVPNIIDAILHHHHGDYRAAMDELLVDADFLRDQLYVASRMMSAGIGRGWRPRYERT
jgi:hypothetical protein